MKSYTAIGTGSTEDAIKQATSNLNNPKFILVFAAIEEIENASNLLMEKYPGTDILALNGSTYNNGNVIDSSNFSGKETKNQIQVIAFFDDTEIACGVMDQLDKAPIYNIQKFANNLNKVSPGSNNTVCLSFSTDFEETFVSTAKTILNKKNIPIVGGSISGAFLKNMETFILLNGKKYYHSTAYVFIKNKTGKIKTFRNDTYIKESNNVMQITKIVKDTAQRTIIDVDGKKIRKILADKCGYTEKEMEANAFDATLKSPIAIVIGDQTYVISVKDFNPDGSANTFKKVHEGGALVYTTLGDYDHLEKELVSKIKTEMNKVSFIFSVDCIYRHLQYSANGYLKNYLSGLNSLGEHAGIIGLGEQNEEQHFNQTMVCAVFE